ncbi:MAG: glycerate kinase, partial [Clostridia bacterium]|nr:glycerate kinase [Clostridia bacterium]
YLGSYASVTKSFNSNADSSYPGAGAAGGLGFAFMAYLGATLSSGIELVMSETGLEEYIKNSDVVITGEGRLDGQSCMGKTPVGVASLAKKYNKPVIAFSGSVTDDATECNNHGIDAFFPILRKICTLDEAMDSEAAAANLSACTRQVFNLIKVFDK